MMLATLREVFAGKPAGSRSVVISRPWRFLRRRRLDDVLLWHGD
jgi:hypothetical protein